MNVSPVTAAAAVAQSYAASRPTAPRIEHDFKTDGSVDTASSAPDIAGSSNAVGKTVNLTA